MAVKNVSFARSFSTKEVANIISGKNYATGSFLSGITGIPEDRLLANNNSDMFIASTSYCSRVISEKHPEFKVLRDTSIKIKEKSSELMQFGDFNFEKIKPLFVKRDVEIRNIRKKLGDIINIESFPIPFLKS